MGEVVAVKDDDIEVIAAPESLDWHVDRICESWRSSVEGIFETGRRIQSALNQLPHGDKGKLWERLPFSQPQGAMLTKIAEQQSRLYYYSNNLPPAWRTLYELTQLSDDELPAFMDSGEPIEQNSVRAWRKISARDSNHSAATPIPDGKYRVIYADPPWKYGDNRGGTNKYSGAEDHYPVMTIPELCALPVQDIAAEHAVLFLWVTSPLLYEAVPIVAAWGFSYKTSIVWDKIAHNVGHYVSVRHEILLICTRGSCTPDSNQLHDSVISIDRGKHSEKPAYFRQLIETMYPTGPRIELFHRGAAPDGWEVWGNESIRAA